MGIYRLPNRVVSGIWRSLETARPQAASDARARRLQKLAVLLACLAPITNFGAAKNHSVSPQLAGYKPA